MVLKKWPGYGRLSLSGITYTTTKTSWNNIKSKVNPSVLINPCVWCTKSGDEYQKKT